MLDDAARSLRQALEDSLASDALQAVEESTRARLGEDDFARATEHGRSLLLEDAVALVFAPTSAA